MDGIFQWNRVPIGLRGAPSYFQQVTTIEVLRELPYSICEIDIDDIIIVAHTKEEMTERLDIVLRCLQEYNATVTPEKCSFEKSSFEFMGHTVDKDGLNFSREKLDKVLMVPQSGKDLKPFLGVCVYVNDMRTTTVTSGHPPPRKDSYIRITAATTLDDRNNRGVLRTTKGSQRMPNGSLRKHRMANIRGSGHIRLRNRSHLQPNER